MSQVESMFELPEVSDETAAHVQAILYTFIDLFDAHYCYKIERYHRHLFNNTEPSDFNNEEVPF